MFAPIKRTPMEWILAKGTELGVTRFQPVITEHTQSERLRPERLQTIMVEAAEQCERLTIPSLEQPLPLREAVQGFEGRIGAAFEAGGFSPVVQQLAGPDRTGNSAGRPARCWSGRKSPPDEVKWLADQDNVFGLSLGPRVLKAETAAIALIAVFRRLSGTRTSIPIFGDQPDINEPLFVLTVQRHPTICTTRPRKGTVVVCSTDRDFQPIQSRDDLVLALEKGCKPASQWRIGTEHEKFLYDLRDFSAVFSGTPRTPRTPPAVRVIFRPQCSCFRIWLDLFTKARTSSP